MEIRKISAIERFSDLAIKVLLTHLLAYSLTHCLYAGTGRTGAEFLRINISARSSAMGDAFTASADDAGALYSNPAGLSYVKQKEIMATHIKWFSDISSEFVGYVHPVADNSTLGISGTYLYVTPFDRTDMLGDATGEKNKMSDFAGIISCARSFGKNNDISLGVNIKTLVSQLGDYNSLTFGIIDVGTIYKSPDNGLKLGLSLQNFELFGMGIMFSEISDPLPITLNSGLSYTQKPLTVMADIGYPVYDSTVNIRAGIELTPIENLCLRGGYKSQTESFSGGFGLNFKEFHFDYAWVPNDIGDLHFITFSAKF